MDIELIEYITATAFTFTFLGYVIRGERNFTLMKKALEQIDKTHQEVSSSLEKFLTGFETASFNYQEEFTSASGSLKKLSMKIDEKLEINQNIKYLKDKQNGYSDDLREKKLVLEELVKNINKYNSEFKNVRKSDSTYNNPQDKQDEILYEQNKSPSTLKDFSPNR